MNKLCSRNTALATAVGRSGLRTGSLSASRGFLSLRCPCSFHPVPRSFQLSFSFSFVLHPPALSMLECPFLAAVDTLAYLMLLPSLSFFQVYFFLSWTTLLRISAVSPLSHSHSISSSLQSMIPVSLYPHSSCGLYCAHARELRCELQPRWVRARTEFSAHYLALQSLCHRPNKYQINETTVRNLDVLITGV